ncbi:MAG: lactate utilization protein, partial [Coriobacteriales bacterium]|nr:lactate utilization protein [Coriobacteriales bacterium]
MNESIRTTIANLSKNNMSGFFVRDSRELIALLSTLLSDGETIGCGDSITLEETGVFDYLRGGRFVFYDKHQPALMPEEKRDIYLKNFSADTFITGTNAVTETGQLFNIDG